MLKYATNIALIKDGVVDNIAWGYFPAGEFAALGYNAIAIDDLPVHIGDTYNYTTQDFYDAEGHSRKAERKTDKELIRELQLRVAELEDQLNGGGE